MYGRPLPDNYIASEVTIPDTPGLRVGTVQYPPTYPREFPALGVTLNVYEGVVDVAIPVTPNAEVFHRSNPDRPGVVDVPLSILYQVCSETICYTPKDGDAVAGRAAPASPGPGRSESALVVCPRNPLTLASRGRRLAETPYLRVDCGRERHRATEVELQTCSSDTPLAPRNASPARRFGPSPAPGVCAVELTPLRSAAQTPGRNRPARPRWSARRSVRFQSSRSPPSWFRSTSGLYRRWLSSAVNRSTWPAGSRLLNFRGGNSSRAVLRRTHVVSPSTSIWIPVYSAPLIADAMCLLTSLAMSAYSVGTPRSVSLGSSLSRSLYSAMFWRHLRIARPGTAFTASATAVASSRGGYTEVVGITPCRRRSRSLDLPPQYLRVCSLRGSPRP